MKYIDYFKLGKIVIKLLGEINSSEFTDEEYQTIEKLSALPIGYALWVWVLLKPNGEVVSIDFDEIRYENNEQAIISTLVWGAKRYVDLAELIPERPAESELCECCNGSGKEGLFAVKSKDGECIMCSGLGWKLKNEH